MKVFCCPEPGGFRISRKLLEDLYERRPELFGEPLAADDFRLPGRDDAQLLEDCPLAVLRNGQLRFLVNHAAVRADPVLVALAETGGSKALCGSDNLAVRVVELPDDLQWTLWIDESGAECIIERSAIRS